MLDSSPARGAGVLAVAAMALTVATSIARAESMRVDRETSRTVLTLPRHRWALSLNLRVVPGTRLAVEVGRAHLGLRQGRGARTLLELPGRRALRLHGLRRGRWTAIHLQAHEGPGGTIQFTFGRRLTRIGKAGAGRLAVRVRRGAALVGPFLVTRLRDTGRLLLHRLAELDARVPPRRFLRGVDVRDRLHFSGRSWTRGFLAGALWQAGALVPGRDSFERAALRRTRATFGYETADTHDVGFVYENSSLAAYRRLCRRASGARRSCQALRTSGLDAADRLVQLAETNPLARTIPTHGPRRSPGIADTIIDSLMNVPLLYWASHVTGDPSYRDVAARHVRRISELLVRPDGSTAQSVHFDRATGRVLRIHTHQGFSAGSTWARGQAWAVYGLTVSAAALRDRALLGTAERTAGWVADRLPASGVPTYDYDAPLGSPEDTSAGVITAAGALRLARLCERWDGACVQPSRWRPLGRRLLRGALRHVSRSAPLGYLGRQVGTFGGGASWEDDAELVYGLRYALEAVRLAR